eukprot:g3585.t1
MESRRRPASDARGIAIPMDLVKNNGRRATGRPPAKKGEFNFSVSRCIVLDSGSKKDGKRKRRAVPRRMKLRIRWPGEKNPGSILEVPVVRTGYEEQASNAEVFASNTVTYPVTCDEKRLATFLRNVGNLKIDVLDATTLTSVGHAALSMQTVASAVPGEMVRSIPIVLGTRKPLSESAKRIGHLTISLTSTFPKKQKRSRRREKRQDRNVEDTKVAASSQHKRLLRRVKVEIRRRALTKGQLFHFMDENRNDLVSFNEFKRGLAQASVHPNPDEAIALFREIDTDEDGRITWAEFRACVLCDDGDESGRRPPTRVRRVDEDEDEGEIAQDAKHAYDTDANSKYAEESRVLLRGEEVTPPPTTTTSETSTSGGDVECSRTIDCTCNLCRESRASSAAICKELDKRYYSKLAQDEKPLSVTPRPLPRPDHPAHLRRRTPPTTVSSSSSSSSSSRRTTPLSTPPGASDVSTVAATSVTATTRQIDNNDAVAKLIARAQKLREEMGRAVATESSKVVVEKHARPIEDDDPVITDEILASTVTSSGPFLAPPGVLPLTDLVENIAERLVRVYAVSVNVSHVLLTTSAVGGERVGRRRNLDASMQSFASSFSRVSRIPRPRIGREPRRRVARESIDGANDCRFEIHYELPTSDADGGAECVRSRGLCDVSVDAADEQGPRCVSVRHQRVFPLIFDHGTASVWRGDAGKMFLALRRVEAEEKPVIAEGHVDLNRVLLSPDLKLTCAIPLFGRQGGEISLFGSVTMTLTCQLQDTVVTSTSVVQRPVERRSDVGPPSTSSAGALLWTEARGDTTIREAFLRRTGPEAVVVEGVRDKPDRSNALLLHVDGVRVESSALCAIAGSRSEEMPGPVSRKMRVTYCSFIDGDGASVREIREPSRSTSLDRFAMPKAEIVMNDLELGDNPYMSRRLDGDGCVLVPIDRSVRETCTVDSELRQYMRHRSLILECWIDGEGEGNDALLGLATVPLRRLASPFFSSKLANVPAIAWDGELSVEDPITGAVVGTISGMLAMGSGEQLRVLQRTR